MAITVDAVSSANGTIMVTSLSWSHTVAVDADCLYVALSIDGGGGTYGYDASCTADGAPMTRVHQGNTNQYLAVFRLLAPTTGTITIQATWTGAQYPAGAAVSLKGVDQTTPEGAVSSSTNSSGSSYSHTIASAAGDAVLTFGSVNNNTAATATGSAADQVQSTAGGAYTLAAIASAAGGASVSVGYSWAAANRYSGASFSVAAAPTVHDLIADDLGAGTPGLGSPALGQIHALTADDLGAGTPGLGSPALGQIHALIADSLGTGAPGLGAPALGQVHALIADDLGAGVPGLGSPALNPADITAPASRTITWAAQDRNVTWPAESRVVTWPATDRTVTWRGD